MITMTNADHLKMALYHLKQLSAPDPESDELNFLLWANIVNMRNWLEMFFTWCTKKRKR